MNPKLIFMTLSPSVWFGHPQANLKQAKHRSSNASCNELLNAIMFIRVLADYHYPDRGCLVDFFAIPGDQLLTWQGIELATFYLEFSVRCL